MLEGGPLLLRMEDCVDVSRTMQHTDDIDSGIKRYVENNVSPNRKAAHVRCQFVTGPAHLRLGRQQPELRIELIHPAIGGGWIVFSDVIPDFQDIGLCKRPPCDMRNSRNRRSGASSCARVALDRFGIPRFTRPAGQPLADIATQLL